jgi:hypothetical protein
VALPGEGSKVATQAALRRRRSGGWRRQNPRNERGKGRQQKRGSGAQPAAFWPTTN